MPVPSLEKLQSETAAQRKTRRANVDRLLARDPTNPDALLMKSRLDQCDVGVPQQRSRSEFEWDPHPNGTVTSYGRFRGERFASVTKTKNHDNQDSRVYKTLVGGIELSGSPFHYLKEARRSAEDSFLEHPRS